ncbi:WD40-repeat-containing domain protein [Paraphysoderma sedebokerense]|nr:WD40-repeat-containing domain protein [Paraphysoderma sedebokerense]
MSLQVTNPNDIKIYRVGGSGRNITLPEWLAKKHKKSLKHDPEWRNRIELLQDFEFPEASYKIKITRDGKYALATGVYKPQMRVYDFHEMSMKFERHNNCENVDFEILSDDWTKSVHLQSDRTVEFHSQYGLHYSTRIPKFGRGLAYHYPTCDLMLVGASNEVWRLNLDLGRYKKSLMTDCNAINAVAINPAHQLFAFGGEDGFVEYWDPRIRDRIARLDIRNTLIPRYINQPDTSLEITKLSYRNDGLHMGIGTNQGQVLLFDLRHPAPVVVKDHQYGFPIKTIEWHDLSGNVISADTKIVKIWDKETGKHVTSVEPPNDINDVTVYPDSGLFFIANEGTQMQTYYVPELGPAPRWCSFLDNLTEELEENPTPTLYDNYKFLTRKELQSLGLDHLIGTNVLKAYMHGFFVDLRLYEKAKAIANPFAYEDYRRRLIREKLEKQRSSRISATKKLPKVNKNLAARLLSESTPTIAESEDSSSQNPLGDSRFTDLFNNPEFEVDENSLEYKLLHPVQSKKIKEINENMEKLDSDSEGGEGGSENDMDDEELSSSSDEEDRGTSNRGDDGNASHLSLLWCIEYRILTRFVTLLELPFSVDQKYQPISSRKAKVNTNPKSKKRGPSLYSLDSNSLSNQRTSSSNAKLASFSERIRSNQYDGDGLLELRGKRSGNMEMRFEVRRGKKKGGSYGEINGNTDEGQYQRRERRGVKELGLRSGTGPDRGRGRGRGRIGK